MDIGTISMRYAKALLAYAKETGAEDAVYREIKSLSGSLSQFPQLKQALSNPVLTREKKCELLTAAAVGNQKPTEEFSRFVRLVLNKHREVYLQFMCLTYISLYYEMKHIAVGVLTTAVPVNEEVWSKMRKYASAALHSGMRLQTVVDPAIEGGFIFDVNDYRLDASVASQLKRVKQQFIEKNKRIV